jgi:hypothetical protein
MLHITMTSTIPTTLKNYNGDVDEVKEMDVLCGSKNTNLGKHPGNLLLKQKILSHLVEYEAATSKQDKMRINRKIVNCMGQKYASRFLKQKANGGWMLIDEQAVRDKVSHALRFASVQKKKEEQYQKYRAALPSDASSTDDMAEGDAGFAQHLTAVHQRQQAILQGMMQSTTSTVDGGSSAGSLSETSESTSYSGFDWEC